ncbi:uncharacterized protein JCM15063_002661 [Sporobolomyces koalae]|uniref:uncharacterized protein n=1 Tax=Sporobolomyces koalae TaxID=500713 RepID=UPI003170E9AC
MAGGPRRLVIVGLGNYTHPMTKHSVGQVLLKNLALRAASCPGATGSPHLQLTKAPTNARSQSWTTRICISRNDSNTGIEQDLELLFVLPKALMNVCGKTIVDATHGFLLPPTTLPTPAPPPTATPSSLSTSTNSKKSGPALKPIYKLLVLSDDLDLAPSASRLQRAGGPKGHNGIRSLISAMPKTATLGGGGTEKDFWRFWIGIGRPPNEQVRGQGVAKWVLGPLGRDEVRELEWDEDKEVGGKVLENAWKEVLRIGFEEE